MYGPLSSSVSHAGAERVAPSVCWRGGGGGGLLVALAVFDKKGRVLDARNNKRSKGLAAEIVEFALVGVHHLDGIDGLIGEGEDRGIVLGGGVGVPGAHGNGTARQMVADPGAVGDEVLGVDVDAGEALLGQNDDADGVIARGDNVVFVCNDNVQIHAVAGYVTQAMEELYSLYPGSAVTADADKSLLAIGNAHHRFNVFGSVALGLCGIYRNRIIGIRKNLNNL